MTTNEQNLKIIREACTTTLKGTFRSCGKPAKYSCTSVFGKSYHCSKHIAKFRGNPFAVVASLIVDKE